MEQLKNIVKLQINVVLMYLSYSFLIYKEVDYWIGLSSIFSFSSSIFYAYWDQRKLKKVSVAIEIIAYMLILIIVKMNDLRNCEKGYICNFLIPLGALLVLFVFFRLMTTLARINLISIDLIKNRFQKGTSGVFAVLMMPITSYLCEKSITLIGVSRAIESGFKPEFIHGFFLIGAIVYLFCVNRSKKCQLGD